MLGEKDNTKLLNRTYLVTPDDITRAFNDVKKFGNKMVVLIEPVCGWLWVVKQLRDFGMEVHISNPRKIRMIADSLKKTDEGDAFVLARLLKTGEVAESYECNEETRKHRSLCRERCFLVNTRSEFKTRLESIVTRDGNHAFLKQAKNRTQIIVANTEVQIHQEAIKAMDDIIKKVEKEISESNYAKDDVKRLMSIPSIGIVSANVICSEIGDIKNFRSANELASFAGLVPRERSSGGKQKLGSITHAGSRKLRYVLVESAMRVRNTEKTSSLYSFYKRIKDKSGTMKARVALARKLLVIIWYMLTKREDYVAY